MPHTPRRRMLDIIQGRSPDRVPFVIYEGILDPEEANAFLGEGRVGWLRWSAVHRVEYPNCYIETKRYEIGGQRWQRDTIHTSRGSISQERAFESGYHSGSIRRHYVRTPEDYEVLWAYLEDAVILPDYDRYHRDQAHLGELGLPLAAVERTPWQQLWVQWVGLANLSLHVIDWPDRVARTVELLQARARRIFKLVLDSPAPFIDFPDNITAPAIGPQRFTEYCVPLYDELAEMMAQRDAPVFVHMDGDLKPLWAAIAASKIGGIDSLAPSPDNDTSVAQAAALWPEKKLWVNFPSSVHLQPAADVRAEAERILAAAGHTGRLQIQISENVPHFRWRESLPAILEAVENFRP